MSKRILIIGAVPHPDDLSSYGGVTTLMQNFLDYCKTNNYNYRHIDTLKYKKRFANLFHLGVRFIGGILSSDVIMYNVSRNGAFTLFIHTAPICYALKKKVVFRKFGGYFLGQLEECNPTKRKKMLELLEKANLVFFETKVLIDGILPLFRRREHIHWFPNCRKPSDVGLVTEHSFQKRFVFVSRVEECKGVDMLLDVAERLPEDYTVHIYGPVIDAKYADPDYFAGRKAKYMGALKTEGVLSTLKEYDVLVLPTCWQNEGYPGIIVEAMSVGMPVIASEIGGIPEMIKHGKNGLLIKPGNAEELLGAILNFHEDMYRTMSNEAIGNFNEYYNSDVINEKVYQLMINL